jgi:hypothetical protein
MESKRRLYEFVHGWNFPTNNAGNYWFRALVTFDGAKRARDETEVTVRVAGYEDGAIEVRETRLLNTEDFHLGFKADFQKYEYDQEIGILVISGNSPKMRGPYRVEITPLDYERISN